MSDITCLYNLHNWLYEHSAELLAVIVSAISIYITLRLAKAAERSANKATELSEQMKDIEIRTESPVVILVSNYVSSPNKLIGSNRQFKAAIKNVGNSVAIGVEIKLIKLGREINCNFGSGGKSIILDKDMYFPSIKISSGDLDGFWLYDPEKTEASTVIFPFEYSSEYPDIDCILSYKSILGHKMETHVKLNDMNTEILILDQKISFNY